MCKKLLLLILSWYLFLCAFYLAYFWEHGLPEAENSILILLMLPGLGIVALGWSIFYYGIGVIALCLVLVVSVLFLKSSNDMYLLLNILIGSVAGVVWRVVSS